MSVRRGAAVMSVAVMAAGLAACTGTPSPTPTSTSQPRPSSTPVDKSWFVQVKGQNFMLNGKPIRFTGFNMFDAASSERWQCEPHHALTREQLKEQFKALKDKSGARVIRFWAYQPYTDGGKDWAGVDRVISVAKELQMLVIPVFEDGPGYCTGAPNEGEDKGKYENDTYYGQGYLKPYGKNQHSLRDYARMVAERYRDETTIAAWMIVNEAETKQRAADGKSVLVEMARDVARVIKEVDPNHLVTLGTQSNGAKGASGQDFRDIYSLPEMDYTEVHDWGYYGSDTEAMPGAAANGALPDPKSPECTKLDAKIACSFAIAKELNKPIVVGEVGIKAFTPEEVTRRATLIGNKVVAAKKAGAVGYLLWEASDVNREGYGIDPLGNDPVFEQLKRFF
jgi:mannan endo-1,4-beta-mannosidase